MVKPPVVYTAGLLRARRPRHRHDGVGVARRSRRAAALLPAERRRLGRHALARHRDVPRPLADGRARARAGALDRRARRAAGRSPSALLDARARVLGHADADADDAHGCSQRSRARDAPRRDWKRDVPCIVENALRLLVATSPDLQTA